MLGGVEGGGPGLKPTDITNNQKMATYACMFIYEVRTLNRKSILAR